jgi:hypothetical protein
LKSEFFLQTQNRQNIVVPVRVKMHDAFAVERFDERFHRQIARRQFRFIVSGAANFSR